MDDSALKDKNGDGRLPTPDGNPHQMDEPNSSYAIG